MNNNFNQNMDGRPPSSASGQSPSGLNDPNFLLQQAFSADASMQQQQQQPFLYNPAFANPAAAAAGMMAFDPSQMMNAQQLQQQQPSMFAFANTDVGGMNPFAMMQPMQHQQQPVNNAAQPFQTYGAPAQAPPQQQQQQQPIINNATPQTNEISDIGGVAVPPMAAGTASILQVEAAAVAAATAAAPSRKRKTKQHGNNTDNTKSQRKSQPSNASSSTTQDPSLSASATALISTALNDASTSAATSTQQLTPQQQKAQTSRDRNREHARCTRLRKKAYVNKLKELVDGLHAERSEDSRKRRVAVKELSERRDRRRKIVGTFLGYHAAYEGRVEKWREICEEGVWMKLPVTPFRSFRRCEMDKNPHCRILKGIHAVIEDAASMSVMIETIGSRNLRWLQRKRDDFLTHHSCLKLSKRNASSGTMPHNINGRLQHAISSLSSSSGSTTGSSDEANVPTRDHPAGDSCKKKKRKSNHADGTQDVSSNADKGKKKVSSSSSSNDTRKFVVAASNVGNSSNDFHDYHAPSLPDPLLDFAGSDGDSDHCVVTKHMMCDLSSGEDVKMDANKAATATTTAGSAKSAMTQNLAKLPPNIARSGGIAHNVTATAMPPAASLPNGHAQLSRAPITALPPFAGIGKKAPTSIMATTSSKTQPSSSYLPNLPIDSQKKSSSSSSNRSHSHNHRGSNIITIDNDTTSSQSSQKNRGIQAYYHINEDDMCITDDVLMCPFTFRSRDAVWCGALAECVMPGMLRVCFSDNDKLKSVELIFDAMGFCQQLEHASGNLGMAQIVPNNLEMALVPNSEDARVITLAKEPYAIVSVNEAWTRMTGYTQLDVEGKDLTILHGEKTDPNAGVRSGLPTHDFASVSKGISACSVNVNYDVKGREFLNFVCSYPLTNPSNEVTHMLHVCQELPARS